MKKIVMLFSTLLITTSLLLANDKSEVVDVVNKHWEYQNTKDWKKYAGTFHSEGMAIQMVLSGICVSQP